MERGGESTSPSLLQKVREHDEQAWGRLVTLYGPLVYGWCRLAKIQDSDAADIGQEVFRAVSRTIGSFVHERGSFRAWLRVITANKIKDLFRSRQRQPQAAGGDVTHDFFDHQFVAQLEDSSSEMAIDAQDVKLLQKQAIELMLGAVDERSRQIFWRVVAEQQTARQVADDLKTSVNTVYLVKSRLLRRLREEFHGLIDEPLAANGVHGGIQGGNPDGIEDASDPNGV